MNPDNVAGARDKREAFRKLHQRPGTFVIPNPWDAGTARILTALGFEALATTSAGYAFSKGLTDSTASLSRESLLENARQIVEATDLPVSADLEDGFGAAPSTCAATIKLAAEIGLAGGSIEDATGDKANPVFAFNHAVERVAAAAEEARKHGFVLTARAENYLWGRPNIEDTVLRLQAFERAGADVLYAPGLRTIEEIRAVCDAVSKPVNVVMGLVTADLTVAQLAEIGVKRISVGGAFARAALGELVRAATEVRDYGTFGFATRGLTAGEATSYMASPKR